MKLKSKYTRGRGMQMYDMPETPAIKKNAVKTIRKINSIVDLVDRAFHKGNWSANFIEHRPVFQSFTKNFRGW